MQAFVCILLLTSFVRYSSSDETLGRVVFASILYRDGDRTPLEAYPYDPYKNESLGQVPLGQLTELGEAQHIQLGSWLRDRYSHLLSSNYSKHDIYISTIDANSSWTSVKANLLGMFPLSESEISRLEKVNESVPIIPVHYLPILEDNLVAGKKFCERYSLELKRVLSSSKMKELDERNTVLYDYLSEKTGKQISSLEDVRLLYDSLYIQKFHNKSVPSWAKSVYPGRLKRLAERSFTIPTYNYILQRLKTGPLLKEIIENMQLKSKDELIRHTKLWTYSVHDDTIANMLNTLGVFEPHCPSSAATLMIELRIKAQDEFIVTVFYKNSTEHLTLLTIPDCAAACPLDEFVRLMNVKKIIPGNWEQECSMENGEYIFEKGDGIGIIKILGCFLVSGLFNFALFFIIYLSSRVQKNDNYNNNI